MLAVGLLLNVVGILGVAEQRSWKYWSLVVQTIRTMSSTLVREGCLNVKIQNSSDGKTWKVVVVHQGVAAEFRWASVFPIRQTCVILRALVSSHFRL